MATPDYQQQFDRFNSDVALHAVTVLRDDGLYRHLRCSAGSYHMQFEIITWPGYLCYCGDMGSYVFSRLPDMFRFFRGRTAMVDRGYLAEKVIASDKHDGIRRYSDELFEAAIKADYDAFIEDHGIGHEEATDLWQCIEDDVLSSRDNHQEAISAAESFRWTGERSSYKGRQIFCEFWERRLEDYTARFVWCCYAIPWAIARYDAMLRIN
jgi:hypothetical protein